jgi:3D (Asp-Asp-Asp) domain-containing protein
MSCSAPNTLASDFKTEVVKVRARITYYSPCAVWGWQVASQKTDRAKRGVTVAAHPNFEFGTKVIIPELKGVVGNGEFIVQDRGSAVTSKKAARGKAYVFDVFVPSSSEVNRLARKESEYMDVIVVK